MSVSPSPSNTPIAIVANKVWEADPLVAVLSSAKAREPAKTLAYVPATGTAGLRGYVGDGKTFAEVWCIEDLIPSGANPSSSQVKAQVLPPVLSRQNLELVIAFGTAATFGQDSLNGCVVIGTNVFVHDAKPQGSSSTWSDPRFEQVVASTLKPADFAKYCGDADYRLRVQAKLLRPPMNPANVPVLLAAFGYVALSDVNIVNYDDFAWADQETVDVYLSTHAKLPIGSLETTHGVVRLCCGSTAFMFVSGITDRVNYFNQEVAAATYAQNFVAAHNAGIAVVQTLPMILARDSDE